VGFRPRSEEVTIEPDRMVRLTILLDPVPFQLDSLLASSPVLRISTTSTELGTRLSVSEISLLPTGKDLRQLISLTPGARPDQIWGGASDQANSYLLDGTSMNHSGVGGVFFLPSPAWVESLEIRGLGADAPVGDFQGGLVDVTTLSGGNQLEGGLRASFESRRLNGSNLIPGEIGGELASRREVDGQVRGPLLRDRLHFALFGHLIRENERVLNQLPGAGKFVPQPPSTLDGRWLGKLSWKAGAHDVFRASLMGRIQHGDRVGQTGYESGEAAQRHRGRSLTGGLDWQRAWSARSALEVRMGGYVGWDHYDPPAGPGIPGIELLTDENGPRHQNPPFRTRSDPSSLGITAIWTLRGRVAGLEHELKTGGELTRGSWDYSRVRNGGMTWRPWPSDGFDPVDPATWPRAQFPWMTEKTIGATWGGDQRVDSRALSSALFLQDRVQIAPWLSLNPGLRFGRWSGALTPAAGPRFTAVRDHAVAPRIGLIADLDQKGGFVAKAHWGRYHQSMFAGLFDRVEGGGVFSDEERWSYLGPAPDNPARVFTPAERDALAAAGRFRPEENIQLDQVGRVENYRQPYVNQTVLSLERKFGERWKAGVTYVHRRNRNQVALVDRNLESNYTFVEDVIVFDRSPAPVRYQGEQVVLERLAISNADIIRVWDLVKRGLMSPVPENFLILPPHLSAAELDALRYEPDYVLTTVPEATRRFEQVQFRLDARYPTWWVGASGAVTSLNGNFNAVSGPDDYSTGGPGPWVRLNEGFNLYGALANYSRYEVKAHIGGLLPGGLRGGAFFSFAGGDRVTPTMTVSSLVTEYSLAVLGLTVPRQVDTANLHPQLLQSINGHRIFLEPRGSYRYESRATLDLHLERSFPWKRTEATVTLDGFNVLGDRSVTAIQTAVNSTAGVFDNDYGRVRARVPARTFRLGAGVRW
jgi:hypothetical protein